MEKELAVLEKLGLNRYESKAYLALVSSGVSTAGKLAEKSGIPRAKVYEVLRGLEKRGFAVSASTRPSKYKAANLDDVSKKLQEKAKGDYERRIDEIGKIHDELKKTLVETGKGTEEEEMVWILRGRENIYNSIDTLLDEAKEKVVAATTEKGVVRKLFRHKRKLVEAKRRGVDVRVMAPITSANAEIAREVMNQVDLRHGNSISARFVLADDKRGVVILHPDDEGSHHNETGLLINSPYFIKGLGHLFEHKWDKTMTLPQRFCELGVGPCE